MSVGKKSRNVGIHMNSNEGQGGKCRKKQLIFLGMEMKEIIGKNLKYKIKQLDCSQEPDHVFQR